MQAKVDVHLVTGARKNEIVGELNGRLKVRINAKPKDGEANAELIKYFSKICKTYKTNIQIVSGQHSRDKTLILSEISQENLDALHRNEKNERHNNKVQKNKMNMQA